MKVFFCKHHNCLFESICIGCFENILVHACGVKRNVATLDDEWDDTIEYIESLGDENE